MSVYLIEQPELPGPLKPRDLSLPRLGEVNPRERSGARTGRNYEYQYERTARAALDLLTDEGKRVCVYCDWHDDYVVEVGDPPTRYLFYQVKGRKSNQGPWSFNDVFGVRLKKAQAVSKTAPSVKTDAIVPRMLLHYANFGNNCAGIAFLTNTGLHNELESFLKAVRTATDIQSLSAEIRIAFDHVARAYQALDPPLASTPDILFAWLHDLIILVDQGNMESESAALLEIADVVFNYSEIELGQRQAKQIAREIIGRVRSKVSFTATVIPTADEQLRREKGVVITELLGVLSLSAQAYEALRSGVGSETVKTLSRLQRFCNKHQMGQLIVPISEFKAKWDAWRTIERHNVNATDFLLLQDRANEVLKGKMTLPRVGEEAKDIAKQFGGIGATPLTAEAAIGLIFSLAAESEALK